MDEFTTDEHRWTRMSRHTRTKDKFPPRKDEQGYLCAFCGARLTGRKRRWCSGKCADAAWEQCSPAFAAYRCEERAKGILALHAGLGHLAVRAQNQAMAVSPL